MSLLQIGALSFIFASLMPVGLRAALSYARTRSRDHLRSLLESLPELASVPTGEYVAHKYGLTGRSAISLSTRIQNVVFEFISILIFISLTTAFLTVAVYLSLHPDMFLQSNFFLGALGGSNSDNTIQLSAARFYAIAFATSYLYTIYRLSVHARNLDLSPIHFSSGSLDLLVSVICSYIIFPALIFTTAWQFSSIILAIFSIAVGLHGAIIPPVIRRRVKRLIQDSEPHWETHDRNMPLQMIDGIDFYTASLLHSKYIRSVEALAAANPIVIFVETTLGIYQVLDLVGQAQLATIVRKEKFLQLQEIGIRTVFDLQRATEQATEHATETTEVVKRIIFDGQYRSVIEPHDRNPSPAEGSTTDAQNTSLKTFVDIATSDIIFSRLKGILESFSTSIAPKMLSADSELPSSRLSALEERIETAVVAALSPPTLSEYKGYIQVRRRETEDRTRVAFYVQFRETYPEFGAIARIEV